MSCVLKYSRIYIHSLSKNILYIVLERFPVIFSWLVIYSFPVTFICKSLNFWKILHFFQFFYDCCCFMIATVASYWKHLTSSLMGVIVDYLFFCRIRRIYYIWSTRIHIYFITFAMHQANTMKDKITTFDWYSQPSLVSIKKWFRKFFDKFIFFKSWFLCYCSWILLHILHQCV